MKLSECILMSHRMWWCNCGLCHFRIQAAHWERKYVQIYKEWEEKDVVFAIRAAATHDKFLKALQKQED